MGDIDLSELGLVSVSHSLQRIVDSRVFPLILSPSQPSAIANIHDWLKTHREVVDQLLRKHRSVLFRGFPDLQSVENFHEAVVALDYTTMDYIGGAAVRTQLTSRVFTANESPSSENIPFHHEMAQTPHPPTHVMFFCAVSPSIGGETPLLVSHEIYDRLQEQFPAIMEDLENTGVKYVRVLPVEDDHSSAIGRGWKSTFLCQTKGEAEKALESLGSSWEWLPNGDVKTITKAIPAIRADNFNVDRSHEKTFFNSIVAAYSGWNDVRNVGTQAVMLADGRVLDAQFMAQAEAIMQEICVAIPWQLGDLMLVDNRTVMHARRPFVGARRILASLARDPIR
jgi:alpha-ketoglutarate-dependent taurine dioxygenase